jgi:tripartite-type tricarboxylate transporter receptor subunit TctC
MNAPCSVCLLGVMLLAQAVPAAEGYPVRPLRIIIPAAPGGGPDITGRILAGEIAQRMGQLVVVENRPGSGGVIGFAATARATPDGYTMGIATFPIATHPGVFKKLPYDALRDFQMVVQIGSGVNILAVSPALEVRSVQALRDHARDFPGKLSFGSAGYGTSMHVSMELFKQMTGVDLLHVPYKGIQQAITDTIAGEIHIVCDNMGSIGPHVIAGRMRALAVTSTTRSPVMKDLPTVAEQGVPGYEMTPWSGFMVPAGVPREIVLRLNAEINRAIQSPPMKRNFELNGSTPAGGTPERFTEHVRKEITKWGQVLKKAGIRPE